MLSHEPLTPLVHPIDDRQDGRLRRAGIDPADLTPSYYRRAACAIMSLRHPPYPTPAETRDRELTS